VAVITAGLRPLRDRRCSLTVKGECAVLGIALREAIAELPRFEQEALLRDLHELVLIYCPRRPGSPVA
jgi:hypothetical protein